MLTTSQTRLKDESTQLSTLLGATWDTDFPSTIMQLTTRQNAFQAALQTAAKIIPLSLVDFL
jgi:flagellin-like hook-associated protein FlgL